MTVTAPKANGVAIPVLPPMVSFEILEVDQVPPAEVSVKVTAPEVLQMDVGPTMVPATGNGYIVIGATARAVPQPLVSVYLIVSIPPEMACTTPSAVMVALAGNTLLQVPPGVPSERVTESPIQTVNVPVMGPGVTGNGLIVTVAVFDAPRTQPHSPPMVK